MHQAPSRRTRTPRLLAVTPSPNGSRLLMVVVAWRRAHFAMAQVRDMLQSRDKANDADVKVINGLSGNSLVVCSNLRRCISTALICMLSTAVSSHSCRQLRPVVVAERV